MTKWWFWLILSGIWIVSGIVNIIDGASKASIIYDFFAAALMAVLGFCRFFLQKKGEKGAKIMKIIYVLSIVGLLAFVVVLLLTK